MSHLMIRKMIRKILLETRGPMGIPAVLKAWVKVAAEHGAIVRNVNITGPGGRGTAETACLKVPKLHAPKVFESLTPDLQEWVLKHWRSEEYFNAMIRGVMIGLVREYEHPSYAGMKSGFTNIRGAINQEGLMVASMGGYLTTQIVRRKTDWNKYALRGRPYIWDNGELNREGWLYSMEEDIAQTESTLVHEFQHWFQESVYYAENMKKVPTRRKGKNDDLPDPKESLPNIKSLKPIHLHIAKTGFSGVDWNTTMRVRGAIAYKLTDPEAFFDSYLPPNPRKTDYAGDGMLSVALTKIQSKGAMKAFIEELLYDFLKLQNIITPEDIDEIADEAMKGGWNPIKTGTQRRLWDRYVPVTTQIDGEEVHRKDQRNWRGADYNPKRDTPKDSGEKTVQGTDSLLKSIGESFRIYILRSSDFDKQGELKPGREPLVPTEARARKATWVVIGRGYQSLPRRSAGTGEWKLRQERGLFKEKQGFQTAWTDRWVEFDAVTSEYMVAVLRNIFRFGSEVTWHLVRGEDENFTAKLAKEVKQKVRNRGFAHVNLDVNEKHIISMAERITDRLIEITEENPYDDWYDETIRNPQGGPHPASPDEFTTWAQKDRPEQAPWGSRPYWEFIFAKASGEDV